MLSHVVVIPELQIFRNLASQVFMAFKLTMERIYTNTMEISKCHKSGIFLPLETWFISLGLLAGENHAGPAELKGSLPGITVANHRG